MPSYFRHVSLTFFGVLLALQFTPLSRAWCQECPDFIPRLRGLLGLSPPSEAVISQIGRPAPTVASEMRRSRESLVSVLDRFNIPPEMRKYYSAKGEFHYLPDHRFNLSVENGDESLSVARIQYDPSDSSHPIESALLADYVHVLNQMPGVGLWIDTKPQFTAELNQWMSRLPKTIRNRIRLNEIKRHPAVSKNITVWAQDAAKPLSSPGRNQIRDLAPAPPADDYKYGDAIGALSEYGRWASRSPFDFAGGNIVVGARNILIGPDILNEAMTKYGISRLEARDAMSAEFGKPVIEVSVKALPNADKPVPSRQRLDFHIDLSLALVRDRKTGKEVVLIHSPEAAINALLGSRDPKSLPKDWPAFCEALVRGAKSDATGPLTHGEAELLGTLKHMNHKDILVQQDQANEIARNLSAQGYQVKFVPGISEVGENRSPGLWWEIFNYTNSIFSKDKAIIPNLDIPALDLAFEKQISELGYTPITVTSPRLSLSLQGGIRCMTETYRNSPPHYYRSS